MAELGSIAPIPYRTPNDGDDDLVLHDHLAPGHRGIAAHLSDLERETTTP